MTEQQQQAVVITGASSGIGRATALRLAQHGMLVFASVRRSSDADALRRAGGDQVVPIELDVTDEASVATAARAVEARLGPRGLDGLVNNAGIGVPGPVEYMRADVLRHQFDVNVFGQLAITQAFLPLIRAARGRIVNIGSIGSHIAFPFGGALCATKAAFTLLNDALRMELRPDGIHVALVEPAAIRTPAVDKSLGDPDAIIRDMPPEGAARYGAMLRELMRRGYAREMAGSNPDVVARAIEHALTARRPRSHYRVGAHVHVLAALPRLLPARVLDRVRLRMFGFPTRFGRELASSVARR